MENSERFYNHESCPIIPEGEEYPSVTTILQVFPKPGLPPWYGKLGTDKAYQFRNLIRNELATVPQGFQTLERVERTLAEADPDFWKDGNIMSAQARDYGTLVHNLIEKWAATGELKGSRNVSGPMKAFRSFLKDYEVEVLASEICVASNKFKFAGRCDFLIKLNGKVAVLDLKVSHHTYPQYGQQLSAYKQALCEMGADVPEELYILNLSPAREGEELGAQDIPYAQYRLHPYTDSLEDFHITRSFWEMLRQPSKKKRRLKANASSDPAGQGERDSSNGDAPAQD